jgi:hypothetical protein
VLLLADRLFTSAELWQAMAATRADLLWRVRWGSKTAPKLPADQLLADGSWVRRPCATETSPTRWCQPGKLRPSKWSGLSAPFQFSVVPTTYACRSQNVVAFSPTDTLPLTTPTG